MDKKQLIEDYLDGRLPLHPERWQSPSEAELDEAEREFDRRVAARKGRSLGAWRWVAAAAAVVLIAGGAWLLRPTSNEAKPPVTEVVETIASPEPADTTTAPLPEPQPAPLIAKASKRPRLRKHRPEPQQAEAPATASTETMPRLETASDSLLYYLTKLEEQIGHCTDSASLAQLTALIRADERLSRLVDKLINRQVDQALEMEMMVDSGCVFTFF